MFNQCHIRILRIFFLGGLFAVIRVSAADASVTGIWKTVDDKTGATRGSVLLYEEKGAIFGKIATTTSLKDAAEVCDLCEGDRRNQAIIGLVFLRNMKKQGGEYGGGDILDPDTGRVYRCKMALEDGGRKLVVRGFLGFSLLGRSQVWIRGE